LVDLTTPSQVYRFHKVEWEDDCGKYIEKMWKNVVLAYFKILYQNLLKRLGISWKYRTASLQNMKQGGISYLKMLHRVE
jgi:hypothetical protein